MIANPVKFTDVKVHTVIIEVFEANNPDKGWYFILIDVVNQPPVFLAALENVEMALNKV